MAKPVRTMRGCMVNSGTEATMTGLRLARGYTKRDKILKFEGGYHGHSDSLLVKAGSGVLTLGIPGSPGVPKDIAKLTLTASFNNLEQVKEIFKAIDELEVTPPDIEGLDKKWEDGELQQPIVKDSTSVHVTLRDKDGNTLAEFIVGKKKTTYGDERYIRDLTGNRAALTVNKIELTTKVDDYKE